MAVGLQPVGRQNLLAPIRCNRAAPRAGRWAGVREGCGGPPDPLSKGRALAGDQWLRFGVQAWGCLQLVLTHSSQLRLLRGSG